MKSLKNPLLHPFSIMKNFKNGVYFLIVLLVSVTGLTSCEKEDSSVIQDQDQKNFNSFFMDIPFEAIDIANEEINVQKLNDKYLIDGDILASKERLEELLTDPKISNQTQSKGGYDFSRSRPWYRNTVYYVFDRNFSSTGRQIMMQAIQIISNQTRIRFEYGTGNGNYIRVFTGQGNYSMIGMTGRRQDLSLRDMTVGIAIHELGHALGLIHEHQRPDRDNHIWVDPNAERQNFGNFRRMGYAYGAFDFNSIMLYPSRQTSRGWDMLRRDNGRPFDSSVENGANRLSNGDVRLLNAIYR